MPGPAAFCTTISLLMHTPDTSPARRPRDADRPPVVDHPVREDHPVRRLEHREQVLLHLLRVLLPREPQPRGDALDVRIHHHALRHPEAHAQHHVRGLAADAGKLRQRVQVRRHLTAVPLDEGAAEADERLRLVAEEVEGLEVFLHLLLRRVGEVLRRAKTGEERRRGAVDRRVRRLRAQDGGDHQLQRVLVVQRAAAVGVERGQLGQDGRNALTPRLFAFSRQETPPDRPAPTCSAPAAR